MEQIVFRQNQLDDLKSLLNNIKPRKIFIVRANESYRISGAELFLQQLLQDTTTVSFYNFDPNPQLTDINRGIALFKGDSYDLVVAIGGGSVLDMAKLISVFSCQQSSIEDIIFKSTHIEEIKVPLLAIPTTAGSGAEATHFAVLYNEKKKYSVAYSVIRPDYVYLSSEFLGSANPYLIACTGLDAFCQAIESIWSINANNESETYALQAIELIWNNLQKAVLEKNRKAKQQMVEASFLSGKAINITKTTAPHALSYAYTSYYNIPHGHAVALSLPFFMDFNYSLSANNCNDPRGPNSVKKRIEKIFKIINAEITDVPRLLIDFIESLGVETNVSTLIKNFNPNIIKDNVNTERLTNNPRLVTRDDIWNFLHLQR